MPNAAILSPFSVLRSPRAYTRGSSLVCIRAIIFPHACACIRARCPPLLSIPAAVVHAHDLRPHSVPVPASVDARASVYVPNHWIPTTRPLLFSTESAPPHPLDRCTPLCPQSTDVCRLHVAPALAPPSSVDNAVQSPRLFPIFPPHPSAYADISPVVATAAPVFDGSAEDSLPTPATPASVRARTQCTAVEAPAPALSLPLQSKDTQVRESTDPHIRTSHPHSTHPCSFVWQSLQPRLRRPVSIRPLPSSPHARLHLPLTDPPQVKATRARSSPRLYLPPARCARSRHPSRRKHRWWMVHASSLVEENLK
ncbi:hypothetical protein C8R44DRAFT_892569 [Mycena epipterygia]|nr:hypothetical protein C8R44DRAFT_892569 [Mycena epipterygia]